MIPMTIEEAKLILKTYTMPMTSEQLAKYKQALKMVVGNSFRSPL